MELKDLKVSDLKEVIDVVADFKTLFQGNEISCKKEETQDTHIGSHLIGKTVLVRTYSAGVHFGELKDLDNHQNVILENSQRIWKWDGACSLSQVAVDGISGENSKIATSVSEILLERAIEIIPMTVIAISNLRGIEVWKK